MIFADGVMHSVPNSSPVKRLILASGYVDYNHLKQRAAQMAEENMAEGKEGKVGL